MPTTTFHVLVICAGYGGLALAQGLKRDGVSVAVYEKQRSRTHGLYGYRVGINPDGNRALRECLPPKLFDTYLATCARAPRYFNILTEKKKRTAYIPLRGDTDPIDSERSVSRQTLRQLLLTGVEELVHFDKTFTRYMDNEDGTVTAHFSDGTTAAGDVLVAADGARSAVRAQYLPQARLRPAGIVAVSAKVPMSRRVKELLPKEVFEGISLVFAPKGFMCIWHVMEFKWDEQGIVKTGIGGNDAELLEHWPGLLFDNTRDYVSWGFWAATDKFPPNVLDLRGQELVDLVLELSPTWHRDLRELFAMADPTTAFPLEIATSEPIEPWQSTNVTLLGDAIHTMTPGQGVGANTSLRDAMMLRRRLVEVRDGSRDGYRDADRDEDRNGGQAESSAGNQSLIDAIAAYEKEMIPYGFARVADSLAQNGTSGNDPLHKPVIGRAVLAAGRGYFRAVDKIPFVQRKFLDELYAYRGSADQA